MAKGNDDKTWIVLLIIGILIIYGANQGWFSNISNYFSTVNNQGNVPNPSDLQNQYAPYQNSLWVNPNTICVGASSTGHIDTNIPNGVCIIFIKNNNVWTNYKNVNLDANGDYSESQTVGTPGVATFVAVCCDSQNNCKISNEATLTVNICNNPQPHEDASNCGDSVDNDGDGLVDCMDPDCNCQGQNSCEVYSKAPQCGGTCGTGYECLQHGDLCSCIATSVCSDSDGDAPQTYGYITLNGIKHNDRCMNGNTLLEQLCAGNYASEKPYDCSLFGTTYCCITNYQLDGTTTAKCGVCD